MQHTLDDFHEHLLLSTSFEGNNSLLGFDHSSSQIGPVTGAGSFIIDDGLFAEDGGLGGLADIGEDLARELGEGWGVDIGANQGFASSRYKKTSFSPSILTRQCTG